MNGGMGGKDVNRTSRLTEASPNLQQRKAVDIRQVELANTVKVKSHTLHGDKPVPVVAS